MKILHITPSCDGYQEVVLLANNVSRNNHLAAILVNEVVHMTGGFLINDTPLIRKILDSIPKSEQYAFVKSFKMDPWAKLYYQDEYPDKTNSSVGYDDEGENSVTQSLK